MWNVRYVLLLEDVKEYLIYNLEAFLSPGIFFQIWEGETESICLGWRLIFRLENFAIRGMLHCEIDVSCSLIINSQLF